MSFLVVSPIAMSDKHRLLAHVKSMEKFAPYTDHSHLVVITPDAYRDMEIRKLVSRLSECFPESQIKQTTQTPSGGWPSAANQHWQYALKVIAQREKILWDNGASEHILPWLWCETDLYPIRPLWLDVLDKDYRLSNFPYMGMVIPSRITMEDKKLPETDPNRKFIEIQGDHMVGAGFYPPHYLFTPTNREGAPIRKPQGPPAGGMNRLWKYQEANYPFDVRCQGEHLPCFNNSKMLHKWRTKNYRLTDNGIFCEDVRTDEFGLTYAGHVDMSGVVLLHGCQDDSLANLIVKDQIPTSEVTQYVKPSRKTAIEILEESESTKTEDPLNDWQDEPTPKKRPVVKRKTAQEILS